MAFQEIIICTPSVVSLMRHEENSNNVLCYTYSGAGRGDIFGLSVDDLTSVVRSNYSVHALTFCDMNKIEAYDLQDIFDMYPEFTENFKKKFSLTFNLRMVCQEHYY